MVIICSAILMAIGMVTLIEGGVIPDPGLPDIPEIINQIAGRSGGTLALTGSLARGNEIIRTWTDPPQQLSLIGPGQTPLDDTALGEYFILWQPRMNVSLSNLQGDNARLRIEITSVSGTWKGSTVTLYKTESSSRWTAFPDVYERTGTVEEFKRGFTTYIGSRTFEVDTVLNSPPAIGGSADHRITYAYKVELWVDGQLVDTKTGAISGTAAFSNKASGTIGLTVTLTPSVEYVGF